MTDLAMRTLKRLLPMPSNLVNRIAFGAGKDIAHAAEYGWRRGWHNKVARVFPSSVVTSVTTRCAGADSSNFGPRYIWGFLFQAW